MKYIEPTTEVREKINSLLHTWGVEHPGPSRKAGRLKTTETR